MIRRGGQKTNSYWVEVSITNSDFYILKFIQERFGGGIYKQGKGVNKVIFQYRIACRKSDMLLRAIEKFSISKKRQVKLAILFCSMNKGLRLCTKKWFCQKMKDLKKVQELPENF